MTYTDFSSPSLFSWDYWFEDYLPQYLSDTNLTIEKIAFQCFSYISLFTALSVLTRHIFNRSIQRDNPHFEQLNSNVCRIYLRAFPSHISLNASSNHFVLVPSLIFGYPTLKNLDLSNNHLSYLPEDFRNLKNLEILNLSLNRFSHLPNQLKALKALSKLDISSNRLVIIDDSISNLVNLTFFHGSNNRIHLVSSSIKSLTNILEIKLDANFLTEIEPNIVSITSLKQLSLSENRISNLSGLTFFSGIQFLNLSNNLIQCTDLSLNNCYCLKCLDLSFNQLSNLRSLQVLSSLEYLDLQSNLITMFPSNVGFAGSIRLINLSLNFHLNELPLTLASFSRLTHLYTFPSSIPRNQVEAVLRNIGLKQNQNDIKLLNSKVTLWTAYANKSISLDFTILNEEEIKSLILWLERLETTGDFSCNQLKLTSLVLDMIDHLEDRDFREKFFNELQSNLTDCEDRSLLNLIFLNLIFNLSSVPSKNPKTHFYLLIRAAKSLLLPKVVHEKIIDKKNIHEDTEVILYIFNRLGLKAGLLLPFDFNMRFAKFAEICINKGENPDISDILEVLNSYLEEDLIIDFVKEPFEQFLELYFFDDFNILKEEKLSKMDYLEDQALNLSSGKYNEACLEINKFYIDSLKRLAKQIKESFKNE